MKTFIKEQNVIFNNIGWIDEYTKKELAPNIVNRIIPSTYKRYFKIFFSVDLKSEHTTISTYKKLSEMAGIEFDAAICYNSFPSNIKYNLSTNNEKNIKIIKELIDILNFESAFLFYGGGDDILPDKYFFPWIHEGSLDELLIIIEEMNEKCEEALDHLPKYIFPKNKDWLLSGTLIYQAHILLLGCNNYIADKITKQNVFEYLEIQLDDSYFDFRRRK